MLSAVLLDVGGTLWPERLAAAPDPAAYLERLRCLLPEVDVHDALVKLRQALARDDASLIQNTHAVLARAVLDFGEPSTGVDPVAIRRALCLPASPGVRLFPGAHELLATIQQIGLSCVILSNVQVRGSAEYWCDFRDLGVAEYIDAVVTSLEVGFRKPHPAMFEAALRAAESDAVNCVMIGNSEVKDIQPARDLGLRTILVAIEEPLPEQTRADAVVESLADVRQILCEWAAGAG